MQIVVMSKCVLLLNFALKSRLDSDYCFVSTVANNLIPRSTIPRLVPWNIIVYPTTSNSSSKSMPLDAGAAFIGAKP